MKNRFISIIVINSSIVIKLLSKELREAKMAQLWEHSPPTNVPQVRFPASASYVGWVCCWFSSLLQEVFLWELQFSPLLKNQQNSNSISPISALH